MDLEVLYEDNHLIAVNKAAGALSQRDSSGEDSLIEHVKAYLKERYGKPGEVYLGTVHRLDRPVTGALVFARTSKAAARLSAQFRERSTEKVYLALVDGVDEQVAPDGWTLVKSRLDREGDRTVVSPGGAHEAALEFMHIGFNGRHALLLVRLITGRKHQIRAQLASLGMPVVGDVKYGSGERTGDGSIMLHSLCLRFSHPTKKTPVEIVAPVPGAMEERYGQGVDAYGLVRQFLGG